MQILCREGFGRSESLIGGGLPQVFVSIPGEVEDQSAADDAEDVHDRAESTEGERGNEVQQKQQEENEQYARIQENLEKLHQENIELARSKPPPETVQAYFEVSGKWPSGWPPWE